MWVQLQQCVAWVNVWCEGCQRRAPLRQEEALHPTLITRLWRKEGLDVIHMPMCEGFQYIVAMRDDFSGWIEAKPLRNAT